MVNIKVKVTAGFKLPPEILKKMKTANMTENPKPRAIMINWDGWEPGDETAVSLLAIWAIINADHKKIKVPQNSPMAATLWFLKFSFLKPY